jgi:hypothetical protein
MGNCIGALDVPNQASIVIQYSANSSGPWSTNSAGSKWIRFSSNGGATFSTAVKYVGDNGSNGSDAGNGNIIYNNMDITSILGDDSLRQAATCVLPANQLASDGDMLRIVAAVTLPLGLRSVELYLYGGAVNRDNELALFTITDTVTEASQCAVIEVTVNRKDALNVFVESKMYRSGNPGRIEDSPEYKVIAHDLVNEDFPVTLGIVDYSTTEAFTQFKMLRVEYYKMIV